MRRLTAAIILSVFLAGICITNSIVVKNAYKNLGENIEICRNAVSSAEESLSAAQHLEDEWVQVEEILTAFVDHDIVDEIGVSIARLKNYAGVHEADYLAECTVIEMKLEHMKDNAEFGFHSFF